MKCRPGSLRNPSPRRPFPADFSARTSRTPHHSRTRAPSASAKSRRSSGAFPLLCDQSHHESPLQRARRHPESPAARSGKGAGPASQADLAAAHVPRDLLVDGRRFRARRFRDRVRRLRHRDRRHPHANATGCVATVDNGSTVLGQGGTMSAFTGSSLVSDRSSSSCFDACRNRGSGPRAHPGREPVDPWCEPVVPAVGR